MAAPGPTSRRRRVGLALPSGCYAAAGASASDSLLRGEGWDWIEWLVTAALYALMSALVAWMVSSGWFVSPDQREGWAMVRAALEAGELPRGARLDAWRGRLTQEIRQAHQGRWIVGTLGLLVVALVAAAAVATDDLVVGLLAVALAGYLVVPIRWLTRRAERAAALLSRVDGEQPGRGAVGSDGDTGMKQP